MLRFTTTNKLIGVALLILVFLLAFGASTLGYQAEASEPAAPDVLRQASGKITLLRAHDVGTGYGPPSDFIDVEVVIQLDTRPGNSMGFQLRNDDNRPAREGMLNLLRDAFNNDWTVTIDYEIDEGDNNGVIRRVWLTK
jgi:hypothetical protein